VRAAIELRVLGDDRGVARLELLPGGTLRVGHVGPGALVVPPAVVRATVRYGSLDRRAERAQVVRQMTREQASPRSDHPAADIHADGGWDDRVMRRDHAADGGALAQVHIRHHRHPLVDERQRRDALELRTRLRLERYPDRPRLDRDARASEHFERLFAIGHRRHGFSSGPSTTRRPPVQPDRRAPRDATCVPRRQAAREVREFRAFSFDRSAAMRGRATRTRREPPR
jgi:hypothetical protein